jgi:hypothetical protein
MSDQKNYTKLYCIEYVLRENELLRDAMEGKLMCEKT